MPVFDALFSEEKTQGHQKDFFVSYNKADQQWAEWIAWQLEEAGYSTIIQAWDFHAGSNFVLEMDKATKRAKRTIVALSSSYLNANFTQPEWAEAFSRDPKGEQGTLLPVRVQECELEGLWRAVVYIDLVDLDEQSARARLLAGMLRERVKPITSPHFPRAILQLVSKEGPSFPGAFPAIWKMPYHRNPFFTERDDILTCLHNKFSEDESTASLQPQVLTGLGGIGKTQIAIEYAYRYRYDYEAVLWVKAESREILITDFVAIAEKLNLPEKDEQDQNRAVGAVKSWLEKHTRWLLILDDVEDPQTLEDPIPTSVRGHILLTTHAQSLGLSNRTTEVTKFTQEEGALFLLRRTKTSTEVSNETSPDMKDAKSISLEVDGLPLALDQAAAYIENTKCSLSSYTRIYQKQRTELLKYHRRPSAEHPESVTTTLILSFQKIEKANVAAAELLRLCAFLYPDEIPEELIITGSSYLGPIFQQATTNEITLNELIAELLKFSLIQRDSNAKTLTIHRLVQLVIQEGMDKNTQHLWAEHAVRVVSQALVDAKLNGLPFPQKALMQAQFCISLIEKWDMTFIESTLLLHLIGAYLHERGQYIQAERPLTLALKIVERIVGPEHIDLALPLHNVAEIYKEQGKYYEAEQLYRDTLRIREKNLGLKHPDVAQSLNHLAALYVLQGKNQQARENYQKALTILEQAPISEHPEMAHTLSGQAMLYSGQGKYDEAEALLLQALAIWERTLGTDNSHTASCLNNLAYIYYQQGRYAQAELFYQRALAILEEILGPEHPEIGHYWNNLAALYTSQGKYTEAESLYQRVLRLEEQTLGPDHPQKSLTLNNLATLYAEQGKYDQAEEYFQKVRTNFEQTLGTEHPHVIQCLANLAELYDMQGKYDQAEPLYKRVVSIQKKTLESDHPIVAHCLRKLASTSLRQGKFTQAESLYKEALAIYEKVLGSESHSIDSGDNVKAGTHRNTEFKLELGIQTQNPFASRSSLVDCLNELGLTYEFQNKWKSARTYFLRALAIAEQTWGSNHINLATYLDNLADLYCNQGLYVQAESYYQRKLAIREKALGLEHPDVASDFAKLANTYDNQGKYLLAELLYQRVWTIQKKNLGYEHPETIESGSRLARIYKDQGKYDQARQYYLDALMLSKRALGTEHRDTVEKLSNLAKFYSEQGQYDEAEKLYLEALEICEQTLGGNHPDVARYHDYLAGLYETQGKDDEAESHFKQALEISKHNLESRPTDVATYLHNLAVFYGKRKKYTEAEPLLLQARTIFERKWGPNSVMVARVLDNLATFYLEQHKYVQAKPLFEKALASYEKAVGKNHPMLVQCLHNQGLLYYEMGDYTQAEELLHQALEILQQSFGPDHPDMIYVLQTLTRVYRAQGKYDEAELQSQKHVVIGLQRHGFKYSDVAAIQSLPASLLEALNSGKDVKEALASLSSQDFEQVIDAASAFKKRLEDLLQAIDAQEAGDPSQSDKMRVILADLEKKGWIQRTQEGRNEEYAILPEVVDTKALTWVREMLSTEKPTDVLSEEEIIDVLSELALLLQMIANVARGDDSQRSEVEAILTEMERVGYSLKEAVQRIWEGERDVAKLTKDMNEVEARLVHGVLNLIAAE